MAKATHIAFSCQWSLEQIKAAVTVTRTVSHTIQAVINVLTTGTNYLFYMLYNRQSVCFIRSTKNSSQQVSTLFGENEEFW